MASAPACHPADSSPPDLTKSQNNPPLSIPPSDPMVISAQTSPSIPAPTVVTSTSTASVGAPEFGDAPPASSSSALPWATRFKSSLRNLTKSATPTYLEDGTPVITAPPSVILKSSSQWSDFIVAHFSAKPPPPTKLYADLNPIWGRSGNISFKRASNQSYLIHIPSVSTREWVLQIGYWQSDNCGFTVTEWSSSGTLQCTQMVSMPIWVNLRNIPPDLYSLEGISLIACGIGVPLHTEKSRFHSPIFGEAKLKVEIQLDKEVPTTIRINDVTGNSVLIDASYPRLPPRCSSCDHYGHLKQRCLNPTTLPQTFPVPDSTLTKSTTELSPAPPVPETVVQTSTINPTNECIEVEHHDIAGCSRVPTPENHIDNSVQQPFDGSSPIETSSELQSEAKEKDRPLSPTTIPVLGLVDKQQDPPTTYSAITEEGEIIASAQKLLRARTKSPKVDHPSPISTKKKIKKKR